MTWIKISVGSEMILLDKILMGVMLIATGTLLFLMYRLARKDPELWLAITSKSGWLKFWNFAKFQLNESIALLSRRKKREKDQRR